MDVLSVTPECYPLVKTGGLADVAGALPHALEPFGVRTRVLLPGYPAVVGQAPGLAEVATVPDLFGGPATLREGRAAGLDLLVIDAPHLYGRERGGPYLGPDGRDWPDNHLRFGALSWVAAEIALGRVGTWRPHLAHLHDWQAALTAGYLHFARHPAPPTLLTIHNLAFQGLFPAASRAALRLPVEAMAPDGMEYWGKLSFLKAGVLWSTHLSTVSPTYAREIVTAEGGMGFDGLLRTRAHELTGIVNGIDDTVWDPATDPHLHTPFSARRLGARRDAKRVLQVELGLEPLADAPLFAVISRLTTQKGLDLLLEVLPHLVGRGAQLAVLGTGEAVLEEGFRDAAERHPGAVATVTGFDEALSHRMQAGADAVVVPSRFEPCGLTQLYALRYGALPVVARVGGLADTVIDANEAALRDGVATGFQFSPVTADALRGAIDRAIDLYADRPGWQRTQRRAMAGKVGWSTAAARYHALYERLCTGPDNPQSAR